MINAAHKDGTRRQVVEYGKLSNFPARGILIRPLLQEEIENHNLCGLCFGPVHRDSCASQPFPPREAARLILALQEGSWSLCCKR